MSTFNGVKVFAATMWQERDRLGERASEWIREHKSPTWDVVDIVVTQSSDHAFHMVAITVFYLESEAPNPSGRRLNFKG